MKNLLLRFSYLSSSGHRHGETARRKYCVESNLCRLLCKLRAKTGDQSHFSRNYGERVRHTRTTHVHHVIICDVTNWSFLLGVPLTNFITVCGRGYTEYRHHSWSDILLYRGLEECCACLLTVWSVLAVATAQIYSVAMAAETDKLNVDSVIQRLLEGTL